jgi:deazaflavin-dependent oxidoreductase (nitroreductase family)
MQRAVTHLHRAVYRASRGHVGGSIGANPIVELTTRGRRSGRPRPTMLFAFRDGEDWVVIASNGGTAGHPQWYRNLLDDPNAALRVGRQTTDVAAETTQGPERDRLWELATRAYGGYASYQAKTDRPIPVVRLRRR